MKFGVNILNFSAGATPDSLLSRVRTAESMGFHSALLSDHVAVTPSVRPRYPEPFYDTFATLAWLSGQTSGILLGTTVCVVPYRHPVEIARLTANIDHFSGGRLLFGVGVGGAEDEFAALGVPFHRRGAITDEYLEVVHALWTQDEVTFHGRFVKIDRVSGIRPFVGPERLYPPVWVGGRSATAMKRAVRFDASWHPNRLAPGWLRDEGVPQLKAIAAATGSPVPALCPRILIDLRDSPVEEPDRQMGVGSLDQVAGDLRLLEELGAAHVLFDWYRSGHLETARDDERGWRMLSLLAGEIIDLRGERLR